MNDSTHRQLRAINRRFYDRHGAEFASRRTRPWPGWTPLLDRLRRDGLVDRPRVLDVGCGHGRFARFLADSGLEPQCLGLDQSLALLKMAGNSLVPVCADAQAQLPVRGQFDLVAAFGLMHHIAGEQARLELAQRLLKRVAPGGWLVLTFWFADSKRRGRAMPMERELKGEALERGDVLFPWGERESGADKGCSVRYCHFFTEQEVDTIQQALNVDPDWRFRADGRENRENEYLVLRPNSRSSP